MTALGKASSGLGLMRVNFTDHSDGPGRAIGPVCVCVCLVSGQ